jgi:hypothetical protein
MNRSVTLAGVALACLGLGGCATGNSDPAAFIKAFGEAYSHCERLVSYSASVGALNPGSGATVNGQIRCPAKEAPAAEPTPPPGGS